MAQVQLHKSNIVPTDKSAITNGRATRQEVISLKHKKCVVSNAISKLSMYV